MLIDWNTMIAEVPSPPNNLSPAIHSLCREFGLHSYIGVLCGWDWAIEHKDQKITYEIELIRPGSKQTINTNNVKALNEAVKIYRK
jgi:hypothetical protein